MSGSKPSTPFLSRTCNERRPAEDTGSGSPVQRGGLPTVLQRGRCKNQQRRRRGKQLVAASPRTGVADLRGELCDVGSCCGCDGDARCCRGHAKHCGCDDGRAGKAGAKSAVTEWERRASRTSRGRSIVTPRADQQPKSSAAREPGRSRSAIWACAATDRIRLVPVAISAPGAPPAFPSLCGVSSSSCTVDRAQIFWQPVPLCR